MIRGSLPVIPTPFLQNRIDYESLERLFGHLFPDLEGYTLAGSTGEAVSLSMTERLELMRFAARNTPAGKTMIVGLTHTNVAEMIDLANAAAELGMHGGLVPCPYYFPNSFAMVLDFFRTLSAATTLPLVLYDNPVFTKTVLRAEEIFQLADACPTLRAVKMTDHDIGKIHRLKRERDLAVFSGDDVIAFRSLTAGVDGSMIITPSVFPAAYQETVRLLSANRTSDALAEFSQRILPFIHVFGPGDEIPVTKAVFHQLGIFRSAEVRTPLVASSPERLQEVMISYRVCEPRVAARR